MLLLTKDNTNCTHQLIWYGECLQQPIVFLAVPSGWSVIIQEDGPIEKGKEKVINTFLSAIRPDT